MKSRLWIGFAVGAAVLALVWAFVSPFQAFAALAEAARVGDRDKLAAMVDFPAVREGLKDQLNARLTTALRTDPALSQGPFGALGALLGPTVVDQVVDAAVTPDGVAAIVRSGRAPLSDLGAGRAALPPPPETVAPEAPATTPRKKTRLAYTDLNHVRATTFSRDASQTPLIWELERRGLGWKLVRIELPPEA